MEMEVEQISQESAGSIYTPLEKSREYSSNSNYKSKCVIANFKEFENQLERRGSERDVEILEETFVELQFEVIKWNFGSVMKHDWFFNKLSEVTKDHEHGNCFVLVIMTHGDEKGSLSSYDKKFNIKDVWMKFTATNCPSLIGKPKIFFIQACRGKMMSKACYLDGVGDQALPIENVKFYLPAETDMFFMFATMEDNVATRDTVNGSIFIKSLCEVLRQNGSNDDVLALMTKVCRVVASESWNDKNAATCKQMPTFSSTLLRFLYFKKKITISH